MANRTQLNHCHESSEPLDFLIQMLHTRFLRSTTFTKKSFLYCLFSDKSVYFWLPVAITSLYLVDFYLKPHIAINAGIISIPLLTNVGFFIAFTVALFSPIGSPCGLLKLPHDEIYWLAPIMPDSWWERLIKDTEIAPAISRAQHHISAGIVATTLGLIVYSILHYQTGVLPATTAIALCAQAMLIGIAQYYNCTLIYTAALFVKLSYSPVKINGDDPSLIEILRGLAINAVAIYLVHFRYLPNLNGARIDIWTYIFVGILLGLYSYSIAMLYAHSDPPLLAPSMRNRINHDVNLQPYNFDNMS